MSILNQLAADVINTVLVDFGESITYNVYVSDGVFTSIPITAVIDRPEPSGSKGFLGTGSYKAKILIANDPVAGVTSINMGKDTITVSPRIDFSQTTLLVKTIIDNDPGAWTLGVG